MHRTRDEESAIPSQWALPYFGKLIGLGEQAKPGLACGSLQISLPYLADGMIGGRQTVSD